MPQHVANSIILVYHQYSVPDMFLILRRQLMKPRIGMLIRRKSADNHFVIGLNDVNAIKNAGGLPVLVPVADDRDDLQAYIDSIDALYVPGGPDINTLLFGEEPIAGMGFSRRSDDLFEMEAVRMAYAAKKPVLGICRGIQVINVALGGTIYQDIPSQVPNALRHRQPDPGCEMTHTVKIEKGSILYQLAAGETAEVNTFHHESIKDAAKCLKVTATAPDGIIEAVESEDGLVFGTQWHPELLQAAGGVHKAVFSRFVEAAARAGKR